MEEILREVRLRLFDLGIILGESAPVYSDEFLIEFVKSSSKHLFLLDVIDFNYSFDENDDSITPTPSQFDIFIISVYTAYKIISADTLHQIKSGKLGVRFRSGQDEISTAEASKHIRLVVDNLYKEYRHLVISKLSDNEEGFQRVQ